MLVPKEIFGFPGRVCISHINFSEYPYACRYFNRGGAYNF